MRTAENHLLALLPRAERKRLLALCEPVQLVLAEVVCEAGERTRHVVFPIDGFISLIAPIDGRPGVEVAMVGHEGMLGANLALGVPSEPLHALVQGSGMALRLGATAFGAELERSPALQECLHRYIHVVTSQVALSAACLRFHLLGPRLARWLLQSHDRAGSDSFHVTHEFLAYMLGVRRVGVTTAAGALQKAGLISYRHGQLTVLDRAGLEAAACSCYAADRHCYARLME